ncbi:SH3 domain-containing protein [Streptomyces longhuiensis]|uniref:SH3 domain-containing protein n=1 Tax=Streptomyces longhuiensis TaxID=2880933 RepID=UPI001D0B606C|nr:SH3 domain-containing protein [Streptomyces longhuiensis]UDM03290.1 SH3 domain-containing protein [Streptomyces longhuiensis]
MSRRHVLPLTVGMLAAPLIAMSSPAVAAPAGQAPVAQVVAKKDFCRITASSATVRAQPRKNASAMGTAYKGDTCTAHRWAGGDGAWVKVTMKGTGATGYVHSSLVAWGKEELAQTGP